nr:MAG TPA: hypothetical protein [Caudoviricetes sp.]
MSFFIFFNIQLIHLAIMFMYAPPCKDGDCF